MARDQFECALGQFTTGRNFMPWRGTGWVWERNHIEAVPRAFNSKFPANYFLEFWAIDELHDSKSADGNNETRPQDSNLIVHPRRAVVNLIRRRNAICTAGIFSGKASTNRCEINV
jgi:hypothetical protein